MIAALPPTASTWSDEQRAIYYANMSAWQKDEVVGVLLALCLGTFGAHHFYMRRPGLGILYCVFSWTGIPTVISLIECFFMPERVRQYNLALAAYFAGQLGNPTLGINSAPSSGPVHACSRCGASLLGAAKYCGQCGSRVG